MKNKLDSFNKDKTKCEKCKEYFDKNDTVSSPASTLCKNCYEKWKKWWRGWRQRKLSDWQSSFIACYNKFINEQ